MSEKAPTKCGVVGTGYLGQHHARIYHELEQCELVGIVEQDNKRAKEICKKYKCERFESIEELGRECEGVSIAVPTDKHCEVALPLLEAGCHLMIEKPICVTLDEAERILAAARKADRLVQVGHIEHFNPTMSYLEEVIDRPAYITAERLAPFNPRGTEVGVVLDLMIHDIGVVLSLVRSPIKLVQSVGVNVVSPTEDIANARLEFENGCVANLNVSRVSLKKLRKIRVFQPRTYLSLDFMEQKGYLMTLQGDKVDVTNIKRKKVPIEKGEPLKFELAAFVNCIRTGSEPKVSGLLGRSALEIAIQVTEQIQSKGRTALG